MAYPINGASYAGNSSTKKFKNLTRDYGAADKSEFKVAKGELVNGPQKDSGYGDVPDDAVSNDRSDRPRRTSSANPIATYKRGGRVARREKAEARAEGGAVPARALGGGIISRARGGSAKKAPTTINIMVGAQQPQSNPALPPTGVGDVPPPMPKPPMAAPPGAGGPPGGPGGMPMPPGAMPPGGAPPGLMAAMGRKRGGGVHGDAKEDAAQIKSMVKESALKHRARGGRLHMTAGAATGEGRLEKAAIQARKGSHKTQEV